MEDTAKLTIPLDKICVIIALARQFDAKDVLTDLNSGSNASDGDMRAVREDRANHPVRAELLSVIWDLKDDEQVDLVTLAWLGRSNGDYDIWAKLRAEVMRYRNNITAEFLLGIPLLGDCLDNAIEEFGLSCDGL